MILVDTCAYVCDGQWIQGIVMDLQDTEDDVRAVSADALLPVADLLAGQDEVSIAPLTSALWDALLDIDELSPSTGDCFSGTQLSQFGASIKDVRIGRCDCCAGGWSQSHCGTKRCRALLPGLITITCFCNVIKNFNLSRCIG